MLMPEVALASKSILVIKQLNEDGSRVIDGGKIIYDGHEIDPTMRGLSFISVMVITIS